MNEHFTLISISMYCVWVDAFAHAHVHTRCPQMSEKVVTSPGTGVSDE